MAQHWQELIPIDRYLVTSSGLLHEYDRKVLTFLYQPLIGSTCLSLYMTLWAELDENRLWSESSTHHLLMNLLSVNLKDIHEARLKLEGIGLLKTYVKTDESGRSFIYEIHPPLNPEQFFLDGMLNIYLYRKIGKNHFSRLKRFFSIPKKPMEEDYLDVTRAFQDVFASATPGSLQYMQEHSEDLEAEPAQEFIGRSDQKPIQIDTSTFDFEMLMAGLNESLVPQKSLTKKVKEVVSNLAFLYGISPIEMKNFILGAINENDEIDIEDLRKGARDWYQFENYDQLPSLINRTQPAVHQVQLTEPKTQEEKLIRYYETTPPIVTFKELSGGVEPSVANLKILEEIMIKYKLPPGVVNVLIEVVLRKTDMKFTKNFVESIASHWARLKIKTVKDAMEAARKEERSFKESKKTGKATNKKPIRTEVLPDWFEENGKESVKDSKQDDPDLEAKKRSIEEKLKAFRK
ncbi:replication initiation and membrane attachment family protein [Neobacillus sp. CF12]|uniref:replication initiation and membrane attachment family protein n=1 Tax=Neobacillus sp. CF12 TaxID=3055864 RepID=UPI0025A1A1A7|nr:replication initiation and membrane attachment family protein [Neobacillus sp. CF12]MDM5330755.1 replication initiation and membrane attachment family protein [Neobacillus sp. CF12]